MNAALLMAPQFDASFVGPDCLPRVVRGHLHGRHGSRPMTTLLKPAALVDDRDGVLHEVYSAGESRRDLAHAVPEDRGDPDTPVLQETSHPGLDQKQRRLGDFGVSHSGLALLHLELVEQRPARETFEMPVHLVGESSERLVSEQSASHCPPLRPLAAKRQNRGGRGQVRLRHRRSFGAQGGNQFSAILPRGRKANGVVGLSERGGRADVVQWDFGLVGEKIGVALAIGFQCRRASGGQGEQMRLRRGSCAGAGFSRSRLESLQDRVGVRSAESERIDAGDHSSLRQRGGFCSYPEIEIFEWNLRIGVLKVKIGRNVAMMKHERRLEQAGDTGRGFEMADHRFDRANQAR